MRWSQQQLEEYQARQLKPGSPIVITPDEGPESKLQAKIEKYCRDAGFYYFHDYSRNVNKPGHPDLVIALYNGNTIWVELKKAKGRMSEDQKKVFQRLLYLGHDYYIITSFKQFIRIVEGFKK